MAGKKKEINTTVNCIPGPPVTRVFKSLADITPLLSGADEFDNGCTGRMFFRVTLITDRFECAVVAFSGLFHHPAPFRMVGNIKLGIESNKRLVKAICKRLIKGGFDNLLTACLKNPDPFETILYQRFYPVLGIGFSRFHSELGFLALRGVRYAAYFKCIVRSIQICKRLFEVICRPSGDVHKEH